MENSTVILLLLFLVSLMPVDDASSNELFAFDGLASEGYVAFVVNSGEVQKEDEDTTVLKPDPDVAKCVCKGTGKIKQVDGNFFNCPYHGKEKIVDNTQTKCQCDTNTTVCNCVAVYGKCSCNKTIIAGESTPPATKAKKKVVPSQKQILFFTASWCPPCQQFKITAIPKLKAQGWEVTTDKDAQIRVIDVDENPELYNKYGKQRSIPLFIMTKDGKETDNFVGNDTVMKTVEGETFEVEPATRVTDMWYEK